MVNCEEVMLLTFYLQMQKNQLGLLGWARHVLCFLWGQNNLHLFLISKAGKVRARWHKTFFSALQERERQGPYLSVRNVVLWIIFLMNSVKTLGNP